MLSWSSGSWQVMWDNSSNRAGSVSIGCGGGGGEKIRRREICPRELLEICLACLSTLLPFLL